MIQTPEQEKIEETKMRIFNLENEVSIATKNLNVVNRDTLSLAKEKRYQEELFEDLVKKVSQQEEIKKALEVSIDSLEEKSFTLKSKNDIEENRLSEFSRELKIKGDILADMETSVTARENALLVAQGAFAEEIKEFKNKVDKLTTVIKEM